MTHRPYATYPAANAQVYIGWEDLNRSNLVWIRSTLEQFLMTEQPHPDTGVPRYGVLGLTPGGRTILLSEHASEDARETWCDANAQAFLT
jgi:hypothetical protein